MGGLINLIKKLFSGIFSFVGGLFGGKKNGGYYMEADDTKAPLPSKSDAKALSTSAKAEAAKAGATVNEAKADLANAEPLKAAKGAIAELANAEPLKAAKETIADSAKAAKEAVAGSATSAKDSLKTAKNEAAPTKAEPAKADPAKVDTASANGSQPPAPANVSLNMPKPKVTFATDYLAPKPTSTRRRPGANMSSFIEMAKSVKPST